MTAFQIRDSRDEDVPAIQAVYAHHVLHGTGTFELEPPSVEDMRARRADVLNNGFPYLVAEADRRLLGYAYANWFRTRPAYRFTVEDSIYVAHDARGGGVGRALLEALVARCEQAGCRQLLAIIGDSFNTGSIALHARCGFRAAGTMRATGWKHGRWLDTVIMQRELGDSDRMPPSG